MTELAIVRWIRELDENGAVALARALVFAEAGRHHLPLDEFTISGRVKARDQGVDGRTHFPPTDEIFLPSGPQVWQIKSGSTPPSATDEFNEQKHPALIEAIRDGCDYVLFWANDPVDPTRTTVVDNFAQAVRGIRADAIVTPLFAEAIERLCHAHLGVLAQQSPIPLAGVVGLQTWGAESFAAVEFQADDARSTFMESIRRHVSTHELPSELHIRGDTGVGKSRLVYEALAIDGVQERVLVVPDASHWDPGLLSLVAQSEERSLIAVVDDCDADDRRSLSKYSGMARGRVRLVTIGSRTTRDRPVGDGRYLELMPLEAAAARDIALAVGLEDADARRVADLTEGYPGLALTLSKAILYGAPDDSLIDRVRGHDEIGVVLAGLLPAEDLGPLGMLSLFEKLGFDEDLARELSIACEVLGVDESRVRQLADRELGRFVSDAGRFRRVTPRLFAIWLASEFIRQSRESLKVALDDLPESLRDRIVTQMHEFAGDSLVAETLGDVLNERPFLDGALADVDEGAARLLHVSALAAPESAMDAIDRILNEVSIDELRNYGPGRRDIVSSLEVLVWFEGLFDRAARALLRLALAENESWGNNATGLIKGLFRVYLGGTSAPYSKRLMWAREALKEYGTAFQPILIEALGHAFDPHELRSSTSFGGRAAPEEWRPRVVSDEVAARKGAWDLLIELAEQSERDAEAVANVIASGLRTAIGRGLAEEVFTDLRAVRWPVAARGKLGEAVAKALRYGDFPAETESRLRDLEGDLRGASLKDRLEYSLSLSPWQLAEDRDDSISGRPKVLQELAAEVTTSDSVPPLEVAGLACAAEQNTVGVLFDLIARNLAHERLLLDLEAAHPGAATDAALLGALAGLEATLGPAWANTTLVRWLDGPLAHLVVRGVRVLSPSDERARLAVQSVEAHAAEPSELGTFLYGAWARGLSSPVLCQVLAQLRDSGTESDVEAALGILDQWLGGDRDNQPDADLVAIARDLLRMAIELSDRTSPMLGLYRAQVIVRLGLPFDERLALWTQLLSHTDTFLDSYDLDVLDALAAEEPEATLRAVLAVLVGDQDTDFRPAVMWLEDAKLLSRLRKKLPEKSVVELVMEAAAPETWPSLVAHIDFTGDEPDPLLVALIGNSDSEELQGRASYRAMYPGSAWSGPESAHLKLARDRVREWKASEDHPAAFLGWLDRLIDDISREVAAATQREAERGY